MFEERGFVEFLIFSKLCHTDNMNIPVQNLYCSSQLKWRLKIAVFVELSHFKVE